jgi:hypothetical protein
MDSCGPLLATHFLLEKQVEARAYGASGSLYKAALLFPSKYRRRLSKKLHLTAILDQAHNSN